MDDSKRVEKMEPSELSNATVYGTFWEASTPPDSDDSNRGDVKTASASAKRLCARLEIVDRYLALQIESLDRQYQDFERMRSQFDDLRTFISDFLLQSSDLRASSFSEEGRAEFSRRKPHLNGCAHEPACSPEDRRAASCLPRAKPRLPGIAEPPPPPPPLPADDADDGPSPSAARAPPVPAPADQARARALAGPVCGPGARGRCRPPGGLRGRRSGGRKRRARRGSSAGRARTAPCAGAART